MNGTLYMVATPIGNLSDISFRAIETLKSVAVIACEDTRVSGKLCAHYNIETPRTAIHQHSASQKLDLLVAQMLRGDDVAYVSDAGTPGISDPGNQLVAAAIAKDISVVPIPGASALTSILSVAGCDTQQFLFLAYPPHKKGRQTFFDNVVASEIPVVYYDSVHRVMKNLELLAQKNPEARIVLGRELTKIYEEILRGSVQEIREYFVQHPERCKGEFVILVR